VGGEIGATGGSIGNTDSWNTGSTALAKPLFGGYQKRKKPETINGKKKKGK
jgi:hypothetical protein